MGFTPDSGFGASGSFVHNGLVTFTSSSQFGSHANYNKTGSLQRNGQTFLNFLFKDFEGQSVGTNIIGAALTNGIERSQQNGGNAAQWQVSSVAPTNLTRSASRTRIDATTDPIEVTFPSGTQTQLYGSCKIYPSAGTAAGKYMRIFGVDFRDMFFSSGCGDFSVRGAADLMNIGDFTQYGSPNSFITNAWNQFEFTWDRATGIVTTWLNGVQQWSLQWTDADWDPGGTWDIGCERDDLSLCSGANSNPWYFADLFYNLTKARFCVGNAPTFAACTRHEPCAPTAWNSSSVTVLMNQGELASLTNAYVYFVDTSDVPHRLGQITANVTGMTITGVRTLTAPLQAPPLTTTVTGSSAKLTWTAPTPTGQSVIAGYRVFKSSSLNGTYTQVGSALPASQLSFTDTLSATTFYKVEAFDQFVTGNRSAGAQCVPVTGQKIRINPGIAYWILDRNAAYQTNYNRMASLKAACPQTNGFEVTIPWAHLENPALVGGAAQYDGSWATGDQTLINNQRGTKLIDTFLARAASLGCTCAIVVRGLGGHSNGGDMSSTNYPTSAAPAYTASSAYGTVSPATNGLWGALWVNCYGPPNTQSGSNGVQFQWYIRWWDTKVTALLKALGAAHGARYNNDPRLELWSFAADEMTVSPATGYSDAQAINALTGTNGLLNALRLSMPNVSLRCWYNYFGTLDTMDTLLAEAVLRSWSVGGPDTAVDKPVVSSDPTKNSDGRYRAITALWRWLGLTGSAGSGGVIDPNAPVYAGRGDYICEVEGEDLAYDAVNNTIISSDGRAIGDGIPFNIVATANALGARRMFWWDNVDDGPNTNRTNSPSPNLCDWLSSAAQGGNVNVNGAVAGISLTTTNYPPTWPT